MTEQPKLAEGESIVSDELRQQMLANSFVKVTLETLRRYIYMTHRDFNLISPEGKIIFDSEEAGLLWVALCLIIGNEDKPSGGTAMVGGVDMSIDAVHALEEMLTPLRKAK